MTLLNEDPQTLAFSNIAQDCNTVVSGVGTKSFQKQIADTRSFSVASPTSGKPVPLYANYVLPRVGVIYYFRDDTDFCLVSSCLHKGHPITAAVVKDMIEPFDKPHFRNAKLEEIAQKILSEPADNIQPITNTKRSRLILGDPNFAHFLWNEFPTIDELERQGSPVDIDFLFDPFGVTGGAQAPENWTIQNRIEPLKGWNAQPILMGTSHFCPTDAKALLLDLIGCKPAPAPANGPPRIYLSIRPSGRTLEDQDAFLIHLITEFRREYPGTTFVLDGFSFPQDFHRSLYKGMRPSLETRVADAKKIVQKIIAALPFMNDDITDITGLSLDEALKIIAGCDYYVTHSGTHQHKIAWVFNRPGFMHGNTSEISAGSVRWIARQVGDSQSPTIPAADDIEDLDVRDMPNNKPRNKRYKFRDMPLVCQNILNDFSQKVGR